MMVGHECVSYPDEKRKGFCVRCGRAIVPVGQRRDLTFEREATESAARGACFVEPLIAHAEIRAGGHLSSEYVSDPGLIRPGRDRLLDAKEEFADARNHLVFWLQEHIEDDRAHVLTALRYTALAYDSLLGDV